MLRFFCVLCLIMIAFGSVLVRAQDSVFEPIPVPNITLYPGDLLTAEKLTTRNYRSSWIAKSQLLVTPYQGLGLVATRTLPKGKPIALRWIASPEIIKQGQDVVAIISGNALRIQVTMVALEGGPIDAKIRLRNPESGAIVSGRIRADGLVDVAR